MALNVLGIQSKVRNLTGLKSQSHITDAALLETINDYYRLKLTNEVDSSRFDSWEGITTQVGDDGFYSLPDNVSFLGPPAYCDDDPIKFYLDAGVFYQDYPDETRTGKTEAVLLDGNELVITPKPDAVYELTFRAIVRPPLLVDSTDIPFDESWGNAIAYGTAIELLMDRGDVAAADALTSHYVREIALIERGAIKRTDGSRPIPRF